MIRKEEPWSDEYKIYGIKETLEPYPDEPVSHILDHAAKKYPRRGIIQLDFKMTYPEIKDHVDRLATALYTLGLRKGDRVATLLPTSMQFAIADYAIARAGLVQMPGSSLEPVETLEHKFKEGTPKALISLSDHAPLIHELVQRVPIDHIILTGLTDYSPNPPVTHKDPGIEGVLWMKDLIKKTEPNPPKIDFDVEKDLELLLFTGGTTGLPKGCMLTHRNIYANVLQSDCAFGGAGALLKGAVCAVVGVPLFHSYGHMVLHMMTYSGFEQIMIPDARDTKSMVSMIRKYRPVMQIGVPTQFMKLSQEELKGVGLLGVSGSAPLPAETQKAFEKKAKSGIMEGYGLSEMSPATHINSTLLLRLLGGRSMVKTTSALLKVPGIVPLTNRTLRLMGPARLGRVAGRGLNTMMGRTSKKSEQGKSEEKRSTIGIPMPDTDIKILDVNTGAEIPIHEMNDGKRGEMCLRGPQRMLGYWPEPGTGIDEDGFVHTSDVVTIDERGYFSVVDRTKDMIIVSGYKVYSRELDDILVTHPAVDMAATVGVPDPEREGSERVVVYIQPSAEHNGTLTEEAIIDYLRERVAKYAIPKYVKFIDEMPLTEVQKLNKKLLREWAAKEFLIEKKVAV